jgi:hypothetical protein
MSATTDVAVLIAAMPAWADVRPRDAAGLAAVQAAVQALAALSAQQVLAGAQAYAQSFEEAGAAPYGVSAMSRLFVLNRWLFDLPASVPAGQAGYGGFLGKPVVNGQLQLRWPWAAGADGRLELTGYFAGYAGESFDGVAEAGDWLGRYGLREPR